MLFVLQIGLLAFVTSAANEDGTGTPQFIQSLDACPTYRGPAPWASFLRRIKGRVVEFDLNSMVSKEGDNVAVLIEPRKDPCIGLIVREVFHYLNGGEGGKTTAVPWRLHIFHGRDNLDFIKQELSYQPDPTCAEDSDATDNILDKVTFTDLSDVVAVMDAAAEVRFVRLWFASPQSFTASTVT